MTHYVFTGGRIGQIVPILRQEVIPGDTWHGHISVLLRLKSLARPVMHPAYIDVFFFYVPHRLVWDGWEDFITDGTGNPPTVDLDDAVAQAYLYGASKADKSGTAVSYNGLFTRAYALIRNEFFRDQDYDGEIDITAAPAGLVSARHLKNIYTSWRKNVEQFEVEIESEEFTVSGGKGTASVRADAIRDSLRDLRLPERRAMFGSRYVDVLRSWGIRTNYQWLDRPESLGRSRNMVSFSDIPATAAGTDVTVGDLYGHGIVGLRHRFRRRVFPEHGYLIGLGIMRFVPLFDGGTTVDSFKSVRDEYWAPEYEMQTPYQHPLKIVAAGGGGTTGGYQPAFEEYRRSPSILAAQVEPGYFAPTQWRSAASRYVITPEDYDHLFNDTKATNPHFQLHAHHVLKAIRPVSRVRTG